MFSYLRLRRPCRAIRRIDCFRKKLEKGCSYRRNAGKIEKLAIIQKKTVLGGSRLGTPIICDKNLRSICNAGNEHRFTTEKNRNSAAR